jgi:homoserine trans-succinylase
MPIRIPNELPAVKTLTEENIFNIYGVYSKVTKNAENGKLSISYFSGHSKKGI